MDSGKDCSMLNICIIESHQSQYIHNCLESLRLNTLTPFYLRIFQEGDSREITLNKILADMSGKDIVVVADDIIFTKGWDQALLAHWTENRILGFSMAYPGGEIIQDRGYRLISIDGDVRTEAIDRGLRVESVEPFEYEARTSMTGCFQAIPAAVAKDLNKFPLEGSNRLGELLYHSLAIRRGIEVGVVGHLLEHHALSTKNNPNRRLSSESYLYEKGIWQRVVHTFHLGGLASAWVTRKVDQDLYTWLSAPALIYGAGTITEFLASKTDMSTHILCSGLPEEDGAKLLGHAVSYKDNVNWKCISRVLITVEGKERLIAKDLRSLAPTIEIRAVRIRREAETHFYCIDEVEIL